MTRPSDELYRIFSVLSQHIRQVNDMNGKVLLELKEQIGNTVERQKKAEELLEEAIEHIENHALSVVEQSCELLGHPSATLEGTHCYCMARSSRSDAHAAGVDGLKRENGEADRYSN